ncbi:hypothetical protein HYC85_010936 [Camellia sinensis]|uniref:Protein kinase domain-containing protein n=1 Tax=Camellia sinensis TaxID=4442 RepID=A0A7J7HJB9_CAMSI|nr:hypothetical protein HYC85_010936 [Camellia sinensis]
MILFLILPLSYLHHEKHIIHRDLKPSNLLVNHRGEVKITDFGVRAILQGTAGQANTFVGTYNYMSPERICGSKYGSRNMALEATFGAWVVTTIAGLSMGDGASSGLPLGANPRRKSTWDSVVAKFQKKLSSWKRRLLSFAGRLTLIKSALSNLPLYFLSIFKMPKGIVKAISKIQANFLWGSSAASRKVHMVKWREVTKGKKQGGLGIRDLGVVNECLLLKWWWRYGSEDTALWKDVICSSLSIEKEDTLQQMCAKIGASGRWQLQFRRPLLSWEEEELQRLVEELACSTWSAGHAGSDLPWTAGLVGSVLLQAVFAISKSDCNIDLTNSTLLAQRGINSSWVSPSGDFTFGFQQVEPSNNENIFFLLAIWFDQIPDKTIVWPANGVLVREGSKVTVTTEGGLQLFDQESDVIWNTATNLTSSRPSCAAMLDTGNFDDGNLVMYAVSIPMPTQVIYRPYWARGTLKANSKSQLIFDQTGGYVYVKQGISDVYNFTRNMGSKQDFYHMARIDFDGVFRLYNEQRKRSCSLSWSVVQHIPNDVCSLIQGKLCSSACAYNSYCTVDTNGKARCLCPEGYSLVDPFNIQKGCKPNFQLPNCQEDGWETKPEMIEFKELNNTHWALGDYDVQRGPKANKMTHFSFCFHFISEETAKYAVKFKHFRNECDKQ